MWGTVVKLRVVTVLKLLVFSTTETRFWGSRLHVCMITFKKDVGKGALHVLVLVHRAYCLLFFKEILITGKTIVMTVWRRR